MPPGVNRGLWDYLHDPAVARNYDAGLAGVSLPDVDVRFVEEHCPRPGWLLDLGCGTGRLLVPFARRGYPVVGVDLSREMLAVAPRTGRRSKRPACISCTPTSRNWTACGIGPSITPPACSAHWAW